MIAGSNGWRTELEKVTHSTGDKNSPRYETRLWLLDPDGNHVACFSQLHPESESDRIALVESIASFLNSKAQGRS